MENPFEIINQKLVSIERQLELINRTLDLQSEKRESLNQWMKIDELSEYISLAKQTIYGMTSNKTIPYYKKGKKLFFKKEEIDKWMNESRKKTQTEFIQDAEMEMELRLKKRRR
jgi:excisionase family DNA binding protein